jgi:WS/DGAT/MGAT family acyltransferase
VDRLSPLDASFLRVETPTAHMHVGWSAIIDLPPDAERLNAAELRRRIEGRLHHVPRFRQTLRAPAAGLGGPSWSDDPNFDLSHHVTEESSNSPSGARLTEITEAFFSEQLPRDRPLWRMHVVGRLSGKRAAVLGKVHHAMVDGIAAVQLGMLLFDGVPEAPAGDVVPWAARRTGALDVALGGARDTALEQFRTARRVAELGLSPGRSLRVADSMRRAAFGLVDDVRRPAPASYLNQPIGPRRRLIGTSLPLRRALAVKERTDSSLNDIVLATVAGALSRLAGAHDEEPADLRAMVPANVRTEDASSGGNAIAFLFVDLPVTASPAERLALVRARMRTLKRDGRVAGTDQMLRLLGYLPTPLQGSAARLAASPRLYNVTISNVPGPRMPLYLAGGRVRSVLPVIPIPDHHAIAVGALTYDQRLQLAAYVDPDALPHSGRLPLMFADAFAELEIATAAHDPRS